MPEFRITAIVERVCEYRFTAETAEEAIAKYKSGALDHLYEDLEFVCERDPDLCVMEDRGEWVDIPTTDEQWEEQDASDASL